MAFAFLPDLYHFGIDSAFPIYMHISRRFCFSLCSIILYSDFFILCIFPSPHKIPDRP